MIIVQIIYTGKMVLCILDTGDLIISEIDICAIVPVPCHQICEEGENNNHICSCHQGYSLQDDGYSCKVVSGRLKMYTLIP